MKQDHFELACKSLGLDPAALPDLSMIPDNLRKQVIALYKLMVIGNAWNGDWLPDWNDEDQRKWFCWFWMDSPGFRFGDVYYTYTCTDSGLGSRLCFKTKELAQKAGEELLYLYEDLQGQ
jgi:hypothetical protein